MEAGAPRGPEAPVPPAGSIDAQFDRDVQADVQRLHELGYKQELARAWSGFTNFAISFTIISVLDRRVHRLARALLLRADGGLLHGGTHLEIPHGGRSLLVGQ